MQQDSEKKPNAFKRFLRDKGYYIVLVLCVAIVGVSGFLFVRTVTGRNDTVEVPTLSVPLTPKTETSEPRNVSGGASKPASSADTEENAAAALGPQEVDEIPVSASPSATVRPLAGETVGAWSGDALVWNETMRDWRVHEGVDIAAAAGSEVVAARDGMVSAVYEDAELGTTVALEHEGGYTSYYQNLSAEPPVQTGQTLRAGEVLGTVGESAAGELALGSHLHFAVACSGQMMDPEEFLMG